MRSNGRWFCPGREPCGRPTSLFSGRIRSARLALYGDLDIGSADTAVRALGELLQRDLDAVVIDLSGLTFMDSTGVKFLVTGRDRAREAGVELSLVRGGEAVRRVLTVSGVDALFA